MPVQGGAIDLHRVVVSVRHGSGGGAGICQSLMNRGCVLQSVGAWAMGCVWHTAMSNTEQGRGFVKKEDQKFTLGLAIGVGIGIVLYHIFFG